MSTWLAPLTRTRHGSRSVVAVGDEDEALDDLAQLRAHGTRGILGRVGRVVERDDLERDALAQRRRRARAGQGDGISGTAGV